VDFGLRHLGLAVSDETGLLARPLRTHRIASVREAPAAVAEAARSEGAEAVVVGVPEGLEGEEARPEIRRVLRFAKALRAASGLPVHLVDESLSSREAGALSGAGRADHRDREHARAATIVLQRWLDDRRANPSAAGEGRA